MLTDNITYLSRKVLTCLFTIAATCQSSGSALTTERRLIVTTPYMSPRTGKDASAYKLAAIKEKKKDVTVDEFFDMSHKCMDNSYAIGEIELKGYHPEDMAYIIKGMQFEFNRECLLVGTRSSQQGIYIDNEKDKKLIRAEAFFARSANLEKVFSLIKKLFPSIEKPLPLAKLLPLVTKQLNAVDDKQLPLMRELLAAIDEQLLPSKHLLPPIELVKCINTLDSHCHSYLYYSPYGPHIAEIFYRFLKKYLAQGYNDHYLRFLLKKADTSQGNHDTCTELKKCKKIFHLLQSSKIDYIDSLKSLREVTNTSLRFRLPPLYEFSPDKHTNETNLKKAVSATPLIVKSYHSKSMNDGNFSELVAAVKVKDLRRMYGKIDSQKNYLVKIVGSVYGGKMKYNGVDNEQYVRYLIEKNISTKTKDSGINFVGTIGCFKFLDNAQVILQDFVDGLSVADFVTRYNTLTDKGNASQPLSDRAKKILIALRKEMFRKVEAQSSKLLSGAFLGIKFTDHQPEKWGNFMVSLKGVIDHQGIHTEHLNDSFKIEEGLKNLRITAIDLQVAHGGDKINVK